MHPPPPISALFPYTTLFRSRIRPWHTDDLASPHAPFPSASTPSRPETLLEVPVLAIVRSEEHTSELQSRGHLVCRRLLEKKRPNPRTWSSDQSTTGSGSRAP